MILREADSKSCFSCNQFFNFCFGNLVIFEYTVKLLRIDSLSISIFCKIDFFKGTMEY